MALTIKQELKRIYKAKDCTDVNDCQIAIDNLRDLARRNFNSYTYHMQIRLAALVKRKDQLADKK